MRHRFVTGFTLIELLVVVTIITLVAGIVIAVTNSTRLAAHDARRKSDVSIIQSASELYYQKTGHYLDAQKACPSCIVRENSGDVGYGWLSYQNPTDFIAPLKQTGLLGAAPRDPVNEDMRGSGKGEFGYAWISNFNDSRKVLCSDPNGGAVPYYTIEVTLEVKNTTEKDLTPLSKLNTAACGTDSNDNNPNGYTRYVRYTAP